MTAERTGRYYACRVHSFRVLVANAQPEMHGDTALACLAASNDLPESAHCGLV
jgi:hypothetical protein